MHCTMYIALLVALVATYVSALELPEVRDQPGRPIDPRQVKNATVTFYNNGTYIYMLEVPCDAYLGGRGSQQQQQQQKSVMGSDEHHEEPHHDDDEENEDDNQQTPQQRQQQQRQRQQRQQQQRSRSSMSPRPHEHMDPEELREAHKGTECECQCKNQEGEELDDIIRVSFGGKDQQQRGTQRGGSRQAQQQRLQQRTQDRQRQQQQSTQQRGRSQQTALEGEGPELVYPPTPRAGQKCIFYEEGEWEHDDDELIETIGPDHKETGEPEEEVLEKCTFNFRKGQQQQQQQGSSQQQQVTVQCVDHEGHQDQYTVRIVDGDLKPKLTPQQKQEQQQQKQQKQQQQGQQRRQ